MISRVTGGFLLFIISERVTDGKIEQTVREGVTGVKPVSTVCTVGGPHREADIGTEDKECEVEPEPETGSQSQLIKEGIKAES